MALNNVGTEARALRGQTCTCCQSDSLVFLRGDVSGKCLLLSDKIHDGRDRSGVQLKKFTDLKEPVLNHMLRDQQICYSAPEDQADLPSKIT